MSTVDILDGIPDGYRVSIHVDSDPMCPREMSDGPVHVLTVPNSGYVDVDKDPGPWGPQWRHLLHQYDWSRALEIMQRYATLVGGFAYDHAPVYGARSLWYLTREDASDWDDPMFALAAHAAEYQAWAEGEVYGWVIESRVTWQQVDDPTITETRWEVIDSCWGFYGQDSGIEGEARAAFAYYLEQ